VFVLFIQLFGAILSNVLLSPILNSFLRASPAPCQTFRVAPHRRAPRQAALHAVPERGRTVQGNDLEKVCGNNSESVCDSEKV
jgi:hypothetical protein